MHLAKKMRRDDGNVIFIIMIAIALLAALTFFVTGSDRGNNAMPADQAAVKANQLLAFGARVQGQVERAMLEGATENQICFYTGSNNGAYNHASCASARNVVFGDMGTIYDDPPTGANDGSEWYFSGGVVVTDVATTAPELTMNLTGVNGAVCAAVNGVLNHQFTTDPPNGVAAFGAPARFAGSYASTTTFGAVTAEMKGKTAFCSREVSTGAYIFTYVLLPR